MALCPLLQAECIRDRCTWWFVAGPKKQAECAVIALPGLLVDTNTRLDRAFSEININGERLLGNYSDEINEMNEERNKDKK